ncbi:MAG: hypothetical protein ABIQ87_08235 [Rubrivivax sp.]
MLLAVGSAAGLATAADSKDAAAASASGVALQTAVDRAPPGWTVLHCGVAKGVLYLTYALDGQAAITVAIDNAAIRARCAAAGYPLGGPARGRSAQPAPSVVTAPRASTAAPRVRPVEPAGDARPRPPPVFTSQAVGSTLSIDARNDGDVPQSCLVSFAYTWDANTGAPRSSTEQATLPARQQNRVAAVSTPGAGARFAAPPHTVCRALE